ncbi:hypothetical protein DL769_006827 [Monosporascus sp. CRB-8-3]|nr:hypothetical protein DL769_006827 [Monosporascus sp. CRB-8-3]
MTITTPPTTSSISAADRPYATGTCTARILEYGTRDGFVADIKLRDNNRSEVGNNSDVGPTSAFEPVNSWGSTVVIKDSKLREDISFEFMDEPLGDTKKRDAGDVGVDQCTGRKDLRDGDKTRTNIRSDPFPIVPFYSCDVMIKVGQLEWPTKDDNEDRFPHSSNSSADLRGLTPSSCIIMNVAARVHQYPGAMNSPNNKAARPPQPLNDYDFDERALQFTKPNSQFSSHDDFYAFLENNRSDPNVHGIHGPLNSNANTPPQQSQMQPQQKRQSGPGMSPNHYQGHTRPPVSNRQRAPSYSAQGSQSEEMLIAKTEQAQKAVRQTARRPVKPPPASSSSSPSSGPQQSRPSSSNRLGGGPDSPAAQQQQQQSPKGRPNPSSSEALAPPASGAVGASIARLQTPSLMDSVLKPLEQKVREYSELMRQEHEQMARLDEELRAMQERRAEAESRFLEAKSKHDDFRRRHDDVERAMRGEPPLPREPQQPPQQQQLPMREAGHPPSGPPPPQQRYPERPMSFRHEEDESDESEDDVRPASRRVQSQQSFGRPPQQKARARDRFRLSLFGDR